MHVATHEEMAIDLAGLSTDLVNRALSMFDCDPRASSVCLVRMAQVMGQYGGPLTRTAVALEMVKAAHALDADVASAPRYS